jgi:ribosomal protein S18 acetylase RimI-like enzyme
VTLRHASAAEKKALGALTFAVWGEQLTPEGYAVREERLRGHPFSRAALTSWVLVDDHDRVLSSCETYRMESRLRRRSPAGAEPVTPGVVYAIASVYTEPALRGRGHASRLMDELVIRLSADDPAAHAAILFSDVGASLYERSGFVARRALDCVFPAATDPGAAGSDLLTAERLPAALVAARPPDAELLVWPTAAQLDWHLERARIWADLLGRPAPESCGARAGASTVFWAGDLRNGRLLLLLCDVRDAREGAALIGAARRQAARAQLDEVRLWLDPEPPPGSALLGGGVPAERPGALPMIRPFERRWPGLRPWAFSHIPRALWV